MPELPEVQTIVNQLHADKLIGKIITSGLVDWPKTIGNLDPVLFIDSLINQHITDIHRRAKYIIIDLENSLHLLIHLRMSGRLYLTSTNKDKNKHEHVILHLDDHRDLRFHDTRKFGRMALTENPNQFLDKLGPEPLSDVFTVERFAKMLTSKHRQLKPLLLDQEFLAGLGNIYVDEALWKAGLHPQRSADTLKSGQINDLYHAIRFVLRQGIVNQGTSLGNGKANFTSAENQRGNNARNLNVFRKTGQPCPRCNTPIKRIIVGQRSTHICPKCQRH